MRNRSGFAFVDLVIVSAVLAAVAGVSLAPVLAGGRLANERSAVISLKTITTAEADFRSNDRDGNRSMDFWTLDVYGLYGMIPITGAAIAFPGDEAEATRCNKLIEPSLAASDGRTDQALYGNVEFAAVGKGRPKRGYIIRALHNQVTGAVDSTLLNDTDGARQFYGACHDHDRFAFIVFPASLAAGRSMFLVNEDNRIWRYRLPANYKATFTGISGTSTDSTSTAEGEGTLAVEFTLSAASGQGTFPNAPATIGCSEIEAEAPIDWDAVVKSGSLSLAKAIDKGLEEAGDGVVLLAEIEPDGKKVVGALDIAKGKEVVAATLDLKDGKVVSKETSADDQSALVKRFKVTAKAAIEAALKEAPGHAMAVELVLHRGQPVIRVRIWSDGKLRVAAVNGDDGSVTAVTDR